MTRELISFTHKTDGTDDAMAAHVNALQNYLAKMWNNFAFAGAIELTLDADGAATVTGNYHTIDTYEDAASGDLVTLNLGTDIEEASILIFRPENSARAVVVKHGIDNILCVGGSDFTLDDVSDLCIALYDETLGKWIVMFGSGGGSSAAEFDPTYLCQGRLTLQSNYPIQSSDQADKTTLYFSPYDGDVLDLYTDSAWKRYHITQLSLDISGLTASKNHDIYVHDISGTPTLSAVEWTDDATRSIARVNQDGVKTLSGYPNYRYLGCIRMDAAQKCQNTGAISGVCNYYNKVMHRFYMGEGTSHYYSGAARLWNNSTVNNQLEMLVGESNNLTIMGLARLKAGADNKYGFVYFYRDAVNTGYFFGSYNAYVILSGSSMIIPLAAGYHTINVYEASDDAGSQFNSIFAYASLDR